MVKSETAELQTEGVKLLQGTYSLAQLSRLPLVLLIPVRAGRFELTDMVHAEIYSASPSHRRECTYYIAVGYYKLRMYGHARKFNGGLRSHVELHSR